MGKPVFLTVFRKKISLTAEVSLLLVLVAIIPLLITVTISQMLSRPQLISQSAQAMEQDARAHVQLIDAYLQNRLRDIRMVSGLFSLQKYMQGEELFKQQALKALEVGDQHDMNYDSWSVLDLQGNVRLWYPLPPKVHGQQLIPPDILSQIEQSASTVFSGVFYDPYVGNASIVVYSPIMGVGTQVVGVTRMEFVLNYVWNLVNSPTDDADSYAFILDQRGVRVAYTSSEGSTLSRSWYLFKPVAPLSAVEQQEITSQDLYGSNEWHIDVFSDPYLARAQNDIHGPTTFEMTPAGQQQPFEVVKVHIAVINWTYFALRPLKNIVQIADQQLLTTVLIAAIALVLASMMGVLMGRRITQPTLRSIEQQQRACEQQQYLNQLKDQILLTVSHELRTPLTEVYGYLELLKAYYQELDKETAMTFLNHAAGGCEELQLLVNDMLDTVRTDNQPKIVHLQDVQLCQVVKEVLDLFNPRTLQNYRVQVEIPEGLSVRADQQYLRQVLRNLVSNAFKYTPQQTQVIINAALMEAPLPKDTERPVVCVRVKDSGPGIASQDIPLLFEKFVRLKRDLSSAIRGVGLGLYISKQLVEEMEGTIWVESAGIAGQGSQFCFTLPLAKSVGDQEG